MQSQRRTARITGVLFVMTFITAIAAAILYLIVKGFKPFPILDGDSSR